MLPPISRVVIRGNRLDDIGTDAIRPANFDDLLVEGNDITGVVESGDHSDALQVVWGGRNLRVRNNVIHDIQGQGLFIKDGLVTGAVIEGNRLAARTIGAADRAVRDGRAAPAPQHGARRAVRGDPR